MTASTGAAAALIDPSAVTLHSFMGVGLAAYSAEHYKQKPPTGAAAKRWQMAKVLIVDEVSMVGGHVLDVLDAIGCRLRDRDGALGGLQLIVAGDFLQLTPVAAKPTFQAATWQKAQFETVFLEQVLRQRDPTFQRILSQLRINRLDYQSHEWLRNHSQPLNETDGISATKLYPCRANTNFENAAHLRQLSTPEVIYHAVDTGPAKELKDCRAKKELVLKVGAQVVCLRNIKSLNLVNGSRGIVCKMDRTRVTVKFAHGETHTLGPMSMPGYRRKQVPLDLAWALTIHSSRE